MEIEIVDCDVLTMMGFEYQHDLHASIDGSGAAQNTFQVGDVVYSKIEITKHYAPISNIIITGYNFKQDHTAVVDTDLNREFDCLHKATHDYTENYLGPSNPN